MKKTMSDHPKVLEFIRFLGEDLELVRRIQISVEVGELVRLMVSRYAEDKDEEA